MRNSSRQVWPELPYPAWKDTCSTLHLWTQIVGKIRLAWTPWLNHSWHVPLYVTARGTDDVADSPCEWLLRDWVRFPRPRARDRCERRQLTGDSRSAPTAWPISMRGSWRALAELGIADASSTKCRARSPARSASPRTGCTVLTIRESARRFWEVLLQVDRVFKEFRTGFLGKSSPVHFFWGSFDLAVTRFSGRRAPPFTAKVPGMSLEVMREAYSHEVSSAGFWPGGNGIDYPAFYSYSVSQRIRGSARQACDRQRRSSTRRSANSSCRTMPCAPPPIPMQPC